MNQKKYTHTPIKGITPTTTLPEGTALVLEGGGTRGFFSSGVFEEFMEAGIMFPYIIGVSAGAANALSYISGQKGRSRQIVTHYVSDKRYVSKRNLIRYRTLFGYEFIFETVPNEHIFWDMENFNRTQTRYLVGVTDCATGEAAWLEKADFATEADVLMANKASCSVPMVAKIVNIGGTDYLDGGIAAPIPIEKSVADGNKFHVIVLTRNPGCIHKPFKGMWAVRLLYKKYPALVHTMLTRHEIYNRQLALCEQLEREGKALIIRPQKPMQVGRSTSDIKKLLDLYDEGHQEGKAAIKRIPPSLRA